MIFMFVSPNWINWIKFSSAILHRYALVHIKSFLRRKYPEKIASNLVDWRLSSRICCDCPKITIELVSIEPDSDSYIRNQPHVISARRIQYIKYSRRLATNRPAYATCVMGACVWVWFVCFTFSCLFFFLFYIVGIESRNKRGDTLIVSAAAKFNNS